MIHGTGCRAVSRIFNPRNCIADFQSAQLYRGFSIRARLDSSFAPVLRACSASWLHGVQLRDTWHGVPRCIADFQSAQLYRGFSIRARMDRSFAPVLSACSASWLHGVQLRDTIGGVATPRHCNDKSHRFCFQVLIIFTLKKKKIKCCDDKWEQYHGFLNPKHLILSVLFFLKFNPEREQGPYVGFSSIEWGLLF